MGIDPLTLIALIQQGANLVPKLIELSRQGKRVTTPEDIAELIAYGQVKSGDYLTAAGIRIDENGNVVPL